MPRIWKAAFWALLQVFCISSIRPIGLRAEPLDSLARSICKASGKVKNRQIAVLPFPYHDGRQGRASTIVSEKLLTKIVDRKKFQVVERSLIEKVMSELKLQNSGAVSAESAKKIGQVLGVEALLTGTLIELGASQIEINARLIQAETGLVLAAASERIERAWPEDVEETPAKESAPADPKEKMGVFFNSREWKDPRLTETGQDRGPWRDSDREHPAVMGNADEFPAGELGGDSRILEPPSALYREVESSDPGERLEEVKELKSAWEQMQHGNLQAAEHAFAALKRAEEGNSRLGVLAQLYLAETFLREGQFEAAVAQAKPIARRHPSPRLRAHALYIIARSSENLERPGVARLIYREIIKEYPYESRLIRAAGQRMRADARR